MKNQTMEKEKEEEEGEGWRRNSEGRKRQEGKEGRMKEEVTWRMAEDAFGVWVCCQALPAYPRSWGYGATGVWDPFPC